MRASSASVSSVMKFWATQPAWLPSTNSFFKLESTVSRNALASAAVGVDEVDALQPGRNAHEIATMRPESLKIDDVLRLFPTIIPPANCAVVIRVGSF